MAETSAISPLPERPLSERIALLGALPQVALAASGLPALLTGAGPVIARSIGVDELAVAVLRESGARLEIRRFDHAGRAVPGLTLVEAGDLDIGAISAALHHRAALDEPDTAVSSHRDLAALARRGLTSAVVVPLVADAGPVGALVAARSDAGFGEPDLRCLELAGALLASAIELRQRTEVAHRAESAKQTAALVLGRRTDELAALTRVADALERFGLGHAVAVVAAELASLRGIELCRITTGVPGGMLIPVAARACFGARFGGVGPGDPAGPGGTVDGREAVDPRDPDVLAVTSGRPVLWRRPDPDDPVAVDGLHRLAVTSAAAVPILWDGRAVGAVMIASTGGHRLVTDEHLVVVEVACRLLAAASGPAGLQSLLFRRVTGSRLVGVGVR